MRRQNSSAGLSRAADRLGAPAADSNAGLAAQSAPAAPAPAASAPAALAPTAPAPAEQGTRADSERFVGFAFAGAELLAETDQHGTVTYAAGAFRSKFGQSPEAFLGRPISDLVSAVDHEALHTALWLLQERGRLRPLILRLANAERTSLALAGLALPAPGAGKRLCLSFARPPAPRVSVLRASSPDELARAAEATLRVGPCDLGLFEIVGQGGAAITSAETIGQVLERAAPNALAQEIAPGRFGLLNTAGAAGRADLPLIVGQLETALRAQGLDVAVSARRMALQADGLTPVQVVRAIRQALNVFAREGVKGLSRAGFEGGLAGYLQHANAHASGLRKVIQDRDFALSFQPIVALTSRAVHHHEALLRPRAGTRFPSVPQEFVVMVEALGLADELDLAVAALACEAAARSGRSIAFNLSGQSVQSAGFRDRVLDLLGASAARKAGLIQVEMTETADIEDLEEANRTAEALRSLGVPFCLDDFGAGAADMRLLRALSPDIVKLDGSYVAGVTVSGRERALLAGMVEMARGAGAKIVAERIETEAEAEILQQLGIHYGQGWLFGRPGPLPGQPGTGQAKVWGTTRT